MKDGFHKIDYQGKVGKRKPKRINVSKHVFVQGWGHSKYKNKWDWRDDRSQPVLQNIQNSSIFTSLFDYDYLQYHVTTDLQDHSGWKFIQRSKKCRTTYYLVKDYLNSFGEARGKSQRDEDILINKVDWWLKKNKVKTL